jgi:hypothetical protein
LVGIILIASCKPQLLPFLPLRTPPMQKFLLPASQDLNSIASPQFHKGDREEDDPAIVDFVLLGTDRSSRSEILKYKPYCPSRTWQRSTRFTAAHFDFPIASKPISDPRQQDQQSLLPQTFPENAETTDFFFFRIRLPLIYGSSATILSLH